MVLKELCGGSLMEGEVLSGMLLNKRIPKSTLAYWEKHYPLVTANCFRCSLHNA